CAIWASADFDYW
nr:immunoglobulin heavy chain junction region [Macaca mulatta]